MANIKFNGMLHSVTVFVLKYCTFSKTSILVHRVTSQWCSRCRACVHVALFFGGQHLFLIVSNEDAVHFIEVLPVRSQIATAAIPACRTRFCQFCYDVNVLILTADHATWSQH